LLPESRRPKFIFPPWPQSIKEGEKQKEKVKRDEVGTPTEKGDGERVC